MKPLRIDFAASSLARTVHRTGPLAWAGALAALLLCLAAALMFARLQSQQRAERAELAAVRARAKLPLAAPVPLAAPRISEIQAAAVNTAVLQLNLPWRALHDAIGSATPASIALLVLEPDARKRRIKLTAEAKSSEDMIAYVAGLKQQELFSDVTLTRHEINDQDPNRPIRFQLEAEWVAQ
jgi:Tfp pilus assembly protein PilN